MTIKEYLKSRGIKMTWFANEVGVSSRTIYNIIEEGFTTKPIAYRIEQVTSGLVPAHSILKPNLTKSAK